MKTIILSFTIIFLASGILLSQTFEYVSPRANSILVSLSTNIILKSTEVINKSSLNPDEFVVFGSRSGMHSGTVKLSDDNKTILFFPDQVFEPSEVVEVIVKPGIVTISGDGFTQLDFQFTTTPLSQPINPATLESSITAKIENENFPAALNKEFYSNATTDTLPIDFPTLKVDSLNNPWDGKIFIANKPAQFNSYGSYLIIADNNGNIIKYRKFNTPESNFRVLPNGELMTSENGRHLILDTTLAPIDTFKCGNGYTADSHDFLLLPNGHALLFGLDPEPVDMSKIVPGGQPNATVIGAVLQELDASKNVIFQWRTLDYIPITDSYTDLTQQTVSYGHANAINIDNDGNILFSLRYCSSIIKINRQTGDVMWIMGGKENQFTFIGEHAENAPQYFSNQHCVSMLPDGDLLLFDNGDSHKGGPDSSYSRGVEYKLDEQAKTATMVWEYDHGKTIYTSSGGSIQRLPNGNTLIGWSRPPGGIYHPTMTEVNDTSIVMEMSFQAQDTLFSYRAFKFPWVSQQPEYSFVQIDPLQGNIYPNPVNPASDTLIGVYVKFDSLNAETYSEFHIKRYNYSPINPTFSTDAPIVYSNYINFSQDSNIHSYKAEVTVQLKFLPDILNAANTIVYKINQSNGHFEPVATSYDSSYVYNGLKNLGKVLMFNIDSTYFGDLLFAVPQKVDSAYAPEPFSPVNTDTVSTKSITFRWGTYGIFSTFHLQIATDSLFNNLIVDTTGFRSTLFTDSSFNKGTFYYWRVSNTNSAGTSSWSDTASFYVSSTVGVENSKSTLPQKFYLSQNYPNPFNPSTIINYEIPRSSFVSLKVYDILGREITTLVNEEKPAGKYNVTFNASKYSSGIYFYRIEAGGFSQIKKMVLLK
jgi:hypothetical protein